MMPFGNPPKGCPQSGEDDRKNIIKQMKVRTIIKGDKSWIHKPDDTKGHTIELPPNEECYSAAPPLITPRKDRPPAPRPSSGYIIRGVFTKPIDNTPLQQTQYPATFETPKRPAVPAKPAPASLPWLSASSYKVGPDDHNKKLDETSCNLLQKSAMWERSDVLSGAKKSSVSSAKDLAPPFMAKRVEVMEDEAFPERSKTLPYLSRQLFSFTSSDSSRERASCSAWAGNMSRSPFPSPRVQEYSGKREETHMGHDPKLESTLLDLSTETSQKRAFLEYKERNISSTRGDISREEEEKDLYADADRSSTWSTDSNHGSNGSGNDLDEIDITSKKGSTSSYDEEYISSTQEGGYEGPSNQQAVKANELSSFGIHSPTGPSQQLFELPDSPGSVTSLSDPYSQESNIREIPLVPPMPRECQIPYWNLTRLGLEEGGVYSPDDQYDPSMNLQFCIPSENTTKYASASTSATTEKRYGISASFNDAMPSEPQRFASSFVSSTDQRFGTLPSMDSMMTSDHSSLTGYEERSVTTIVRETRWDNTGLAGAKGGACPDPNVHYGDYFVITPDSTHQLPLKGSSQESSSRRCVSALGERTSMGSRDNSSALDTEPSSNSSNLSPVICTYCCKEIRSGPRITLEHLGICCHECCFKCGICKRKTSNMLDNVYIHKGIIHCDQCYARLF